MNAVTEFNPTDYQPAEIGFQCFSAPILYAIDSATNNLVNFSVDALGSLTSSTSRRWRPDRTVRARCSSTYSIS